MSLFNLIKSLCIFKVIRSTHVPTLCILGDAIASFLETPDVTTKSLGITSRKQIVGLGQSWSMKRGRAIQWKPGPVRWRHAVPFREWAFVVIVSVSSGINVFQIAHTNFQVYRYVGCQLDFDYLGAPYATPQSSKHHTPKFMGQGFRKDNCRSDYQSQATQRGPFSTPIDLQCCIAC